MEALEFARWQFGITTVYHFIMVPLTIGLGFLVAVLNTMWVKTRKEEYLSMTKFWGKLFLINFIMGVATGLVQEFQFGMAWSEYSRFVGDIFGALLAMEALLAFFFESTFIGLWIFGWKRLNPKVHCACLWIASLGTIVSAYFILVANSWMQHPVGYKVVNGRPVLDDIGPVLTNNTAIVAFVHTIFGAFAVAGGFLLGISWYKLYKRRVDGIDTVVSAQDSISRKQKNRVLINRGPNAKYYEKPDHGLRNKSDYTVWIKSLRLGGIVALIAFTGVALSGDMQGKLMYEQQPMKMAAAEAACHTGTSFSILSLTVPPGSSKCDDVVAVWEVPGLLSFLAKENFDTAVPGINQLLPEYEKKYGTHLPNSAVYGEKAGEKIDYLPVMEVTYWGFRLMITFGLLSAGFAALALWLTRKGTVPQSKVMCSLAVLSILAPFGANITGWVFTEMGRQPFVVVPNPDFGRIDQVFLFTAAANSPHVTSGQLIFSLISFIIVYFGLLVVEVFLMVKYVKKGVVAARPELLESHSSQTKSSADDSDDDHEGREETHDNTKNTYTDVLDFAY